MRNKFISNAVMIALISQVGLGIGCNHWWHRTFGPKTQPGTTGGGTPGPLGPGTDINNPGGERANLDGKDYHTGQFPAVYFDYDSATIKPSEFSKLNAVVAALKGNSKKLVIEGYTDERGSAEYNRALGERRAEAALKALAGQGIEASRMSTISYGKDRPADASHDDSAWSRNRRCEFGIVGS